MALDERTGHPRVPLPITDRKFLDIHAAASLQPIRQSG
jgi:hypothetical protein